MSERQMESRVLVALVSTVISEILVTLFSSSPSFLSSATLRPRLLPLLLHYLSSSELAASSISILSASPFSRKRKRLRSLNSLSPGSSVSSLSSSSSSSLLDETKPVIPNPLPNPDSFPVCFRMTSATFQWLCGLLEPLLDCRDPVDFPLNLSAQTRLGIGLFRLASGSSYSDISRRFGVSESTSRFCTKQLCRVLCTNFRFWLAFPTSPELESVCIGFENLAGLPNCGGVVDCTRFQIVKEKAVNSNENLDSIVAQIVVDSSSRILSIATGFHGDKGDSRVLKSSSLYKDIESGQLLNSSSVFLKGVEIPPYLIGDGGYPLLPWLMVPFVDPVHSYEKDFNIIHHSMRQSALRTLASLKNWGILNRPIDEQKKMAVACIGACSILHNALLMREDYSALSDKVNDFSSYDQCSQYYRDASLEEYSIEKKASIIRTALAGRTTEICNSKPFKLGSIGCN